MGKRTEAREIQINGINFFVVTPAQVVEYHLQRKAMWKVGTKYLLIEGKNWYELYQAAGYDTNKLDMAYPAPWRDNNPEVDRRFRKGDYAGWYYGGKHRIMGEPAWRSDVQRKIIVLANRKLNAGRK